MKMPGQYPFREVLAGHFSSLEGNALVLESVKSMSPELSNFFEFLYGDVKGYAYLAVKNPSNQASWKQEFYAWPTQKKELCERIESASSKFEVYFGPALYGDKSATKPNVLGSNCLWVEFDGQIPPVLDGVPEPTITIRSSSEDHQHWYWKLDSFIKTDELELRNRQLAIKLGSDISGWDATQVLRPPGTNNHKRSLPVQLLSFHQHTYSQGEFDVLPTPPSLVEENAPSEIPAIEDVISQYKFEHNVFSLFKNGVPQGSRSEGLMALGYYLAEMQLQSEEVLALLLNADERWGKFSGRNDQVRRLMQIVTIARIKYPLIDTGHSPVGKLVDYGFLDLLKHAPELEWAWEGFLEREGYMLLTGPSGVGKTQFSLNFAARTVLGSDYLNIATGEPKRVGFLSLEMGRVELAQFMGVQWAGYTKEEQEVLAEHLRLIAPGEPYYLQTESDRDALETRIHEMKLDGLVVDSLGSMADDLVSEKEVKTLMNFNDRIRQRHKIFTWFVHHHRKASGDNKKPNKQADVYGNQYITARATSIMCLWETPNPNTLRAIPLKVRLAKKPPEFYIYRDENLQFSTKGESVAVTMVESEENTGKKNWGDSY
jgi:KaiC/GvpD/RAD55 family RecA-like ATPase